MPCILAAIALLVGGAFIWGMVNAARSTTKVVHSVADQPLSGTVTYTATDGTQATVSLSFGMVAARPGDQVVAVWRQA